MAVNFSRFNIFAKLGARGKIALIVVAIVAAIIGLYFLVQYMSSDTTTTGASSIATGPGEIAAVPGGQLTPEYYRALQQANTQAAARAKSTGASAIPTVIKTSGEMPALGQSSTRDCTVLCSDEQVNVKSTLDDWVGQGELTPETSSGLQQLADKNLSVDDYAAELDRLVKAGKLTPEQARRLLEQYKKQHTNTQLKESAKLMDEMIKNGALPLDVANDLLLAQKNQMSGADYSALLDKLVKAGKISSDTAKTLLAQYSQQRAKNIIARSVASLKALAANGQLAPEVEKALIELEYQMVPISTYQDTLNKFIGEGKLIPLIANKIIAEYREQKAEMGSAGLIYKMLREAEAAAYGGVNDLLKSGTIPQQVADQLTDAIHNDVTLSDYINAIQQLEKDKKLTPDMAAMKISDFRVVKGLRKMAPILTIMQENDVPVADYAAELKRAVGASELTPEQAKLLLDEYQSLKSANALAASSSTPAGDTTSDFAKLQQRLQQSAATTEQPVDADFAPPPPGVTPGLSEEDLARQRQLQDQLAQQQAQAIQAMASAMASQAQQLVAAWQPPTMQNKEGTPETPEDQTSGSGQSSSSSSNNGSIFNSSSSSKPLIKAGTIMFAVLDTAVNSDYPDTPVMATVVDGKYKGAKLMGKLQTTKGVSGQMDRVSLNFTLMNMDEWDKSLPVSAFGIDPDTARTVLASSVDYHYLKRFGAIMATSFLQGYASAITNAGTSTTGIFGTSTTHPELSPSQKIYTALGQMGQTLGAATQNYVNTPPTVKVNAGVGLGILVMSDVTKPSGLESGPTSPPPGTTLVTTVPAVPPRVAS